MYLNKKNEIFRKLNYKRTYCMLLTFPVRVEALDVLCRGSGSQETTDHFNVS